MPYCESCGTEYSEGQRFCASCGASTPSSNDPSHEIEEPTPQELDSTFGLRLLSMLDVPKWRDYLRKRRAVPLAILFLVVGLFSLALIHVTRPNKDVTPPTEVDLLRKQARCF